MKNIIFNKLKIRNAVVAERNKGYLLCNDTDRDEYEDPHSVSFVWKQGVFKEGGNNFNAHTSCLLTEPELCLVMVAENGHYGAIKASGSIYGDLLGERYTEGGLREVREVNGKAYTVGIRGVLY